MDNGTWCLLVDGQWVPLPLPGGTSQKGSEVLASWRAWPRWERWGRPTSSPHISKLKWPQVLLCLPLAPEASSMVDSAFHQFISSHLMQFYPKAVVSICPNCVWNCETEEKVSPHLPTAAQSWNIPQPPKYQHQESKPHFCHLLTAGGIWRQMHFKGCKCNHQIDH